MKRLLDIICSLLALVVFSPLWIVIALAIVLESRGGVLYRQERVGRNNRDFMLYKFRTMRTGSDKKGLLTVGNRDSRVTRVGYFPRKYKLDEFPQLVNIIKGDMSIVGPRPHMVAQTQMYSELIDKYMLRHTIKPGITGWAQVRGYRGQTEELWQMEKRVEFDVWYAENWSFFLDLKIIFRTIWNALTGEDNAY